MKKMPIIFLVITMLISCSKECDVNKANNDNPFIGEWNVKSVSGGFSQTEFFQKGDIIFDFMENDLVKINLEITFQSPTKEPIKNDTIIHYKYDSLKIFLGSQKYGYRFVEEKLQLDNNLVSDGIMIELERY